MPNWCTTELTVTGPQEEIEAFIAGFSRTTNEETGSVSVSIIEGHIPCPQELRILAGAMSTENPDYENWQKQKEDNVAKYGFSDWYEWQYSIWGTKWGDCDTEVQEVLHMNGISSVSISFQTAWGTADKAWETISKKFPNCSFLFTHDEEAGFFAGSQVYRDGSEVFSSMFSPNEEFSGEDFGDEYYEWLYEKKDKCEDLAYEFITGGKS